MKSMPTRGSDAASDRRPSKRASHRSEMTEGDAGLLLGSVFDPREGPPRAGHAGGGLRGEERVQCIVRRLRDRASTDVLGFTRGMPT